MEGRKEGQKEEGGCGIKVSDEMSKYEMSK